MNKSMRKFIDIGANLTDAMYQGVYHGSKKHQPDLTRVLERAWGSGVQSMIITVRRLLSLPKPILQLCNEHKLPLFLHCRAAADDLVVILNRNRDSLHGGVVHSFDGNQDALNKILDLGFSLRTEENLEVASKIPTERLLIETDCPWCEVKPTHPGYKHVLTKFPSVKKEKFTPGSQVKGRNEPVNIVQVLEVLAAIRNEDIDQLSEAIYENTNKLFFCNMSL
ncbi:unnamed protein product [Leptidea sinapis]|uniref:Deoxyribonuclease TATDN1 n=1 Tax=Leptidea sinapis TaxID=189913 RepID=A0A5E4R2B5_9NEOP|nr:unnamed protein product [Leptidea sinapis]